MDDKDHIGSLDKARINIHENYEVEYWSQKFGITPEQLKRVVETVGVSSVDIENHLKK